MKSEYLKSDKRPGSIRAFSASPRVAASRDTYRPFSLYVLHQPTFLPTAAASMRREDTWLYASCREVAYHDCEPKRDRAGLTMWLGLHSQQITSHNETTASRSALTHAHTVAPHLHAHAVAPLVHGHAVAPHHHAHAVAPLVLLPLQSHPPKDKARERERRVRREASHTDPSTGLGARPSSSSTSQILSQPLTLGPSSRARLLPPCCSSCPCPCPCPCPCRTDTHTHTSAPLAAL